MRQRETRRDGERRVCWVACWVEEVERLCASAMPGTVEVVGSRATEWPDGWRGRPRWCSQTLCPGTLGQ